ncbi:MAG: peptide deformylase [Saprospiraceae bacterium]|nr:peptide deformylase [Saprospiraceae bacterium]
MVLPIYAYGTKVLKKKAVDIKPSYAGLGDLLSNMWETMYNANGVGLAAPQIGHSIRIFLVDTTQIKKEDEEEKGIKQVFINAHKVELTGEVWAYEEGCLSIPDIRGDVDRPSTITLRYLTPDFVEKVETFSGLDARVIQHEYDHLDGILFTESLKPLRKRRIKRKLEQIKKGIVDAEYPMRFV